MVANVGCGLDLPGSSRMAGHARRFILSGQMGETQTRPGAMRGGEKAGLTSQPEVSVGEGVVWGLSGIREVLGCGFNCC